MAVVSDYQSFKDYLVTFLWKSGDTVLIANLDNLIRQGEASINRELREEMRHASTTLSPVTETVDLPTDYYSIRSVTDASLRLGEFKYVSPAELVEMRQRTSSTGWWPIYSLRASKLLLVGPADGTQDLLVEYVRKAPQFLDTDASWLTEDNLDLLTYATLYHTAPFLREDERVQVWQMMYKDIINTLNEQSAHEKQRGVYDSMGLPRDASGRVRSGQRRSGSYKYRT